jgi:hypothetical protein
MSQQTISPIKYVPYIVLYVNGIPLMLYQGPSTEKDITDFIVDVSTKLQKKQPFSKEKVKDQETSGIPSYTIGKPICGDGKLCYLEFANAYTK